jgi:predicted porin
VNFNRIAIALTVAGVAATPIAARADMDQIYSSIRVGLENYDSDTTADLNVRSYDSRFGAAGETDLGNGMAAYGRFELEVDFEDDRDFGQSGGFRLRQRWVGLKSDFGTLQIGQGWWTFYNFAVGPIDNPFWHSGYAMTDYRERSDDAITYTSASGAINFGVSAYFTRDTDEVGPDQFEIGASFPIGDLTLGVAIHATETTAIGNTASESFEASGTDPTEDVLGIVLSEINLGDAFLGVGFQSQDDDNSLVLQVDAGRAYLRVEWESLDAADQDRVGLTLGYNQILRRKTSMHYEYWSMDNDGVDETRILAALRVDLI